MSSIEGNGAPSAAPGRDAATPRSSRIVLIPDDPLSTALLDRLREQNPLVLLAPPDGAGDPAAILFQLLEIDLRGRYVRWAGRPIDLSEHEFSLLTLLAGAAGRAYSFKEVFAHVWNTTYHVDRPVLHSAVRRLRRKLAEAGAEVQIESVRGYGFRLARTASSG